MEMLKLIIRAPIFYQIAIFALQFSIFLYEIDVVSSETARNRKKAQNRP